MTMPDRVKRKKRKRMPMIETISRILLFKNDGLSSVAEIIRRLARSELVSGVAAHNRIRVPKMPHALVWLDILKTSSIIFLLICGKRLLVSSANFPKANSELTNQ